MSKYIYPIDSHNGLLPAGTIFRDLDDAYVRGYRKLSGGKAEPRSESLLLTAGIFPYTEPTFDSMTHKRGTQPVPVGDSSYTWEVVEKTAEDLKAETYVESITPRQCRIWLKRAGLLTNIKNFINGLDEEAQIEWEYALEIRRDHTLVLALVAQLGMTEDDLHQMFYQASQI